MTEPLHPSLLQHLLITRTRAQLAALGCIAILWFMLAWGRTQPTPWQKAIVFGIGTVAGFSALSLRRIAIDLERTNEDVTAISHDAFQRWLMNSLAPSATTIAIEQPIEPLQKFDWSLLIREPDTFPHLLLLGKTGAGKSWLGERLLDFLGDSAQVVTPHRKPSDFAQYDVVGAGRNYPAIERALVALAEEMQSRYERYTLGDENYPTLNVLIDEFPAIAANTSGAVDIIKTLAREARKVKIRLILLSQGDEVKTLGIEGEGSLRECFTFIRLKGFVEKYAKSLKHEALTETLKQYKHPCMVEDSLAETSDLFRIATLPENLIQDAVPFGSPSEPASPAFNPGSTQVQQLNLVLEEGYSPPEPSGFNDLDPRLKDELRRLKLFELRGQGLTKKQIIFVVWGLKSGGSKAYKEASQEFDRLINDTPE